MEYAINDFQMYYVPKITIMDNLFLVCDVMDLANAGNEEVGFLSIDQEKVFDKIDHICLKLIRHLFLVIFFFSWIKLLYTGASALLKVGGGLSYPVLVHRCIRQAFIRTVIRFGHWSFII